MNFFQANLREHITTEFVVGCGDDEMGSGVQNGYFPSEIDPTVERNMFETGVCLPIDSHDGELTSISCRLR